MGLTAVSVSLPEFLVALATSAVSVFAVEAESSDGAALLGGGGEVALSEEFVKSIAIALSFSQDSPSKGAEQEQKPSMHVPWPLQLFLHCGLSISQRNPVQPSWQWQT